MAAARHLAVPQDENDMLHLHKVTFQESGAPAGKGFSSRAPSGYSTKTPGKGLSSGRKALGNITNTAGKGLQEGGTAKTPGAGKAARRVLGDVTNRTPGVQLGSAPSAAQHQAAAPQTRAELYAADGVERRAGKGWHQLEAERLQGESAAAKQRAQDAILPWVTRRLPTQDLSLQQLAQRSAAAAAAQQEEEILHCPPSAPLPDSPVRAGARMGGVLPADTANPAALLPDIDDLLSSNDMNLND